MTVSSKTAITSVGITRRLFLKKNSSAVIFAGALTYGSGGSFLLGSCEKKNPKQLPAKLFWDRQTCAQCAMAISDRRYAAQLVKADGKAYFFDDIGCALNFIEAQQWQDQARIWVTDVNNGEWIDAAKASWQFGDPNTPMGYGFVASLTIFEGTIDFDRVRRMMADNLSLRHHHLSKHLQQ